MSQVTAVTDAYPIQAENVDDIFAPFCAHGIIVIRERPGDGNVFMGITACLVKVMKIPFFSLNIIMIFVRVAGGNNFSLHLWDLVTKPFIERIHEHACACSRGQEKIGDSIFMIIIYIIDKVQ